MSLWRIAWNYLWNRKLTTSMTIISVALSVGLITAVLILRDETERRFVEEGQAYDLVVGTESPLQVVLSTVYFIDKPTTNIPFSVYTKMKSDPEVLNAFPICLGDTFNGYYIVGTSVSLLEHKFRAKSNGEPRAPFTLAEGTYFAKPFEAVVGFEVARDLQLKVGDTFASQHGTDVTDEHEELPYTVTGILKQSFTPNDRVIFSDYRSMWLAHAHEEGHDVEGADEHAEHEHEHGHDHEHERFEGFDPHDDTNLLGVPEDNQEVTSVLAVLESPGLRFSIQQRLRRELGYLIVEVPVNVIKTLYDQLLGTARTILLYIGYLVVAISSISILIGLYMSILQRKRDLAVMRALGASSGDIVGSVIIEAFLVTLLGIGAGWLFGVGATWGLSQYLADRIGFTVSAYRPSVDLFTAYSAVLLMGMLAGLVPAWQAYRTDVAKGLTEM
ncbi:MAG: hypothetical protein AMXMBFR84_19870 [Candidatus Hydrogenedentota bacterium]